MNQGSPVVSVIIATYNWSAALRCAIRSVLAQTIQDFELLVVGDHCTDDSEAVVASFGDRRIHWRNLTHNHGGQWAPNNFALDIAVGEYIAYLGQDDLWYPTHLSACLRTAGRRAADLVAAVTILYGPPETGERWVSGVFQEGLYAPTDFMPSSSIMHRKSLIDRIGPWKDPVTTVLPVDCEFLKDAYAAGARIEPTNELTAFKFNAAWRRDSYRWKSVDEQKTLLEKIESGEDFRAAELTGVLRAITEGRTRFLQMPSPAWPAGEMSRQCRIFKGVEQQFSPGELRRLDRTQRFTLNQQYVGFEWHLEEVDEQHGPFRWSGPSNVSTIDLPVLVDRDLAIRMHVLHVLDHAALDTLRLFVNSERIDLVREETVSGTFCLSGIVRPGPAHPVDRAARIAIRLEKTRRPLDSGGTDDRRLGIAVSWIELGPAQAETHSTND